MDRAKDIQDAYTVSNIFARLDKASKLMVLGYLFALSDSSKIPKPTGEENLNLSKKEDTPKDEHTT